MWGQSDAVRTIHCYGRKVVGDPGIEPGVRLREGVTVPCHTLRPVAHDADRIASAVKA